MKYFIQNLTYKMELNALSQQKSGQKWWQKDITVKET